MVKLRGKIFYYLVSGLGFYSLWFLFKLGGMPNLKLALFSTGIDVLITYCALYLTVEILLPKHIPGIRYSRFAVGFLLIVLIAGSVMILAQLKLMGSSVFSYRKNIAKYQEHYFYWFWSDLVFGSYFLVAFISLAGCAMRLIVRSAQSDKMMEKLEKEKIASELIMLRQQINPHFLFNSINTLYYKIEKSNGGARNILEKLSDLLRYQLYECDQPTTAIEKEMKFLMDYIHLQAERLTHEVKLTSRGLDKLSGFQISPYLLAPLIENCFKHTPVNPKGSYIHIECNADNDYFWLSTENTSDTAGEPMQQGIGLTNILKRLQLVYPERHKLELDKSGGKFKVNLQLNIK
jgi:two-component system LytT family sensor kinase